MEADFRAPIENKSDQRGFSETKIEDSKISIHEIPEPPISIYEKVRNTPYLVDFYGIRDIAEKMGLIEKARFISDFIISEIQSLKYTDTKESFAEILSKISESLPENLDPKEKIRRIEQLIRIIKKERELKEKREWLLTGQK
jgi:hypothetical protein